MQVSYINSFNCIKSKFMRVDILIVDYVYLLNYCVCDWVCHGASLKVRGHLLGVGSLLSCVAHE